MTLKVSYELFQFNFCIICSFIILLINSFLYFWTLDLLLLWKSMLLIVHNFYIVQVQTMLPLMLESMSKIMIKEASEQLKLFLVAPNLCLQPFFTLIHWIFMCVPLQSFISICLFYLRFKFILIYEQWVCGFICKMLMPNLSIVHWFPYLCKELSGFCLIS